MLFGLDRIISEPSLRRPLSGKRVALLGHPASVAADLTHALDALPHLAEINLTAAFGPQHGLRGDKQDNMVESQTYFDSALNIPVFSLYGEARQPTAEMMDAFDVILVDLQDIGCRVYTYITTLRYVLEASALWQKEVWVLDRPNPIGRQAEGFLLEPSWESFVGSGRLPMRHGLTLGELAAWYVKALKLDVDLQVVDLRGWEPEAAPGFGWPLLERAWVNPSPNAPNLWMARAFPGTVMLEGTTLSEGRGTTRPLEIMGAPDIDAAKIVKYIEDAAPSLLNGCILRPCCFEPTYHKHSGRLCQGIQIHTEGPRYNPHSFKPWRLASMALKGIRSLYPEYELWRDFPYEYEHGRLAIDLINGGARLRAWVDCPRAQIGDLEEMLLADEQEWLNEREDFIRYRPSCN